MRWSEASVRHLMARTVGPTGKVSHAVPITAAITRKYGNKPTVADGIRFASRAEARRYGELKLMQAAGDIAWLECHPKFHFWVNGHCVGSYTADFQYQRAGVLVVEDVKSKATRLRDFPLRANLMHALFGIEVQVIS